MKENDFTWKWRLRDDEKLVEAYDCIGRQLRNKKSRFPAVAHASIMTEQLRRNHWLTRTEVHHHVFLRFLEQKKHELFNPEKSSLQTYTGHHCYLELRHLLRDKTRDSKNEKAFLFMVKDEGLNPIGGSGALLDSTNPTPAKNKTWKPLLHSQCPLLDRMTESASPEDILIEREFMVLVYTTFDEADVMVLQDKMKKTEAASELNINYDAYCKRLQRKISSFRVIATQAGYC